MNTTQWALDPTHSEIGFKIRHLMISNVSGSFGSFDIQAETPGEDFSRASVKVRIDVASINTNNSQRDEHLRNADFFEAETYPHILFESTRVERKDDETFILHGKLSIKNTALPVAVQVEYSGSVTDPYGQHKAGFSISGRLNRKDWGISYNAALETGGVMLGEEIKFHGDIQLVRQAALQTA